MSLYRRVVVSRTLLYTCSKPICHYYNDPPAMPTFADPAAPYLSMTPHGAGTSLGPRPLDHSPRLVSPTLPCNLWNRAQRREKKTKEGEKKKKFVATRGPEKKKVLLAVGQRGALLHCLREARNVHQHAETGATNRVSACTRANTRKRPIHEQRSKYVKAKRTEKKRKVLDKRQQRVA